MGSLLGGGVCLWRGVVGLCPACPGGGGGERERGAGAPQILITCPGLQGTPCPCSLFMIRVGRPWNLLLLLMGPGPPGSF